jgi:hypothetical protein
LVMEIRKLARCARSVAAAGGMAAALAILLAAPAFAASDLNTIIDSVRDWVAGLLIALNLVDRGASLERVRAVIERLPGTEEPGQERALPAYEVGDRVLVHDPDPPHRLWEGRVTNADSESWEIAVADRPAGELLIVDLKFLHAIPMTWTRDCPFCRLH